MCKFDVRVSRVVPQQFSSLLPGPVRHAGAVLWHEQLFQELLRFDKSPGALKRYRHFLDLIFFSASGSRLIGFACRHLSEDFLSHIPLLRDTGDSLPAVPHILRVAAQSRSTGKLIDAAAPSDPATCCHVITFDRGAHLSLSFPSRITHKMAGPRLARAMKWHVEDAPRVQNDFGRFRKPIQVTILAWRCS
jgi:hypothetical protein